MLSRDNIKIVTYDGVLVADIVASNKLLSTVADQLRTLLNTGHTLRLFKNNITPTPANLLADFVESTYLSYAGISLSGAFTTPIKVIDGEYQTSAPTFTFSASAGATPENAYGFYIDDGTYVKFSMRFSAPVVMGPSAAFTLQLNPQVWAKSIL